MAKATQHFKEQMSAGMKKVEVPEWETTLYFKPLVSFAQEQSVIQLHSEGKQVEALVQTLITRACDEDGKRVFTAADKVELMNRVDPNVILRIVNQMNAEEVSEEDLGN